MAATVDNPLMTIAIPTFNRASWLRDCLIAALAQTYPHFEVVVSDNASTDETVEVLDRFGDRRIHVIRQRGNIGQTANWNACLAEAKGDYIVFVPDDDRIHPWLLERCVALIGREPQIQIVMALGDTYLVAEDRSLAAVSSRKLPTGIWDGIDILQEYLKGHISVHGCTTVIRTEALRASGGFPAGWPFAADLARHLPLLFTGKAGLVNECCGTYSVHSATITSNQALEAHLADLQKLMDLIVLKAQHTISDLRRRRGIELQAERFFAMHAFGVIASHRKRGAKSVQVFPLVWQWRARLTHLSVGDAFGLARLLALLVLPFPMIRWLRRLKHISKVSTADSAASV